MGMWEGYGRNLKRKQEAEFFEKHGMTENDWYSLKINEAINQLEKKHGKAFDKLVSAIKELSTNSNQDQARFFEQRLWEHIIRKSLSNKYAGLWISYD